MPAHTPYGPDGTHDPATPDYLGDAEPAAPGGSRGSRRGVVLGIAAVAVAGTVAVGAWGVAALLGGGDQPAQAIPADAVGYVSFDLDPSASQKIEAVKILEKFPAIAKELTIDSRDDLRRWIFEEAFVDSAGCETLDYVDDVEPWIGNRVAFAALPGVGKGTPTPVFALQVTDPDAAQTGIDKLVACQQAEVSVAFSGDYAVVAEGSGRSADEVVAAAEESSLADDADFQRWTDEVGDPGIVTMYASADAPAVLAGLQEEALDGFAQPGQASSMELSLAEPTAQDDLGAQFEKMYADFEGMAGVVRFQDGAVEVEVAGKGLPDGVAPAVAPSLTDLPATTGAALSFGLSEGWLDLTLDNLAESGGAGSNDVDQMLAEAEQATGLDLPEDAETLLGDGFTVSLDADVDLDALFEAEDPAQIPVGIRVSGDPERIMPVVEKLKAAIGPDAELLEVRAGDGVVAFGLKPAYVEALAAGGGGLGDQDAFTDVVPEAAQAQGAFFLNFDAGGWLDQAAQMVDEMGPRPPQESESSDSMADNVRPLSALGVSGRVDDDGVFRGLFRLATN